MHLVFPKLCPFCAFVREWINGICGMEYRHVTSPQSRVFGGGLGYSDCAMDSNHKKPHIIK